MNLILQALIGPAAIGIVIAGTILWDRLHTPRLDRPLAVVDETTYRQACHRVDRLVARGDIARARSTAHAVCCWLRYEIRTGRRSRRAQRAANLEQWQLRMTQDLALDQKPRSE